MEMKSEFLKKSTGNKENSKRRDRFNIIPWGNLLPELRFHSKPTISQFRIIPVEVYITINRRFSVVSVSLYVGSIPEFDSSTPKSLFDKPTSYN